MNDALSSVRDIVNAMEEAMPKIKGKGRRLIFATVRQECVELHQLRASWLLDIKDVPG